MQGRESNSTDVSTGAYAGELRTRAEALLSAHPQVPHEWQEDGTLVFPASAPDGFEVALQPGDDEITVLMDCGLHEHFKGVPLLAATDAVALARDLLGPNMRVRELCAGDEPHGWVLERHTRGGWVAKSVTGRLFWNYFGRRSQRIYRNTQLPVTSAYAGELRAQASTLLSAHPQVPHEWQQDGALVFPASSPEGFEVTLQPGDDEITVFTDCGLHQHFESVPLQAATDALALARDLLSPDMRVRELCAGGEPYGWVLERRTRDGWVSQSITGLLLWNYFGRRSERIYRNTLLPVRRPAESSEPGREGAG